ncbi:hypothetical protein J7T55_003444 [Diaporthe amygdali]|uniref:uncharacterized protein n=1 Tax=Phomopsis amygdali TaxID=1214568 RepID=UPI0022FE94F7|nr:uncharacterized protein J7T55_003444 [Diaporthe amygdali]KAJ0117028.1 hypothetical protein J7T55_003444 [Diaporthe amygdali]
MAPLLAAQPLKAIYATFIVLTVPNPLGRLVSGIWHSILSLEQGTSRMLTFSRKCNDPKEAKERFVQIEPPPTNFFSGVLAPTGPVKPAPVKGVWLPSLPPQNSAELRKEKVILHLPGGAFVVTFGHEFSGRPVMVIFTQHLKVSRVLWSHYRLAEVEESRFPGAVQDALTFYRYVLSLGYEPENIILSGDSAGGNVALALLRYLEAAKLPELPPPGRLITFSPWVSVTANAGADFENSVNHECDILYGPFLQWGAEAYLPSARPIPPDVQPYISPIHHPFQTAVPIFIWAGAAEAFCGDIRTFADEMAKVQGNKIQYHEQEKAAHDLLMNLNMFKLEEGFYSAMSQAYKFLSNAE